MNSKNLAMRGLPQQTFRYVYNTPSPNDASTTVHITALRASGRTVFQAFAIAAAGFWMYSLYPYRSAK